MTYELFAEVVARYRDPRPSPNYIRLGRVSANVNPEVADCWNELEGVRSVEQTGEPLGWRSLERADGVWQLRSGESELVASRGREAGDAEDWWLTIRRDGEPVVEDHRVRVGGDSDLGEALAAVLTTATRLET
jgi:hypothetical protein